MKAIGIFEAKTRLSSICEEVAKSREAVIVTRRGTPLVRIEPVVQPAGTIQDRRKAYMGRYGHLEQEDSDDFKAPPRSRDMSSFRIED